MRYSQADCNSNGIEDWQDIAEATSTDCDSNGVPDECPGFEDINTNGIPDPCEVPVLLSARTNQFHSYCVGMTCFGTLVYVAAGEVFASEYSTITFELTWESASFNTNGASLSISDFAVSSGTISLVTNVLNKSKKYSLYVSGIQDQEVFTVEFTAQTAAGIPKSFSLCWPILVGDSNQDGVVDADGDDLDLCASHNGESPSIGLSQCDLDTDNIIEWASGTLDDYDIADAHDGNTVGFCEAGN